MASVQLATQTKRLQSLHLHSQHMLHLHPHFQHHMYSTILTLRHYHPHSSRSMAVKAMTGGAQYDDESSDDIEADRSRLNSLLYGNSITGQELRQLLVDKWGRSYDVSIQKRGPKVYLHIFWKYLGQQSFPLTETEYLAQLDAVAYFLSQWGVVETVRQGIRKANKRGPGYTGGGGARAISIPLDVDLSGNRSGEWNL